MSVSKENTPCKSTKISNESKKETICKISKNEDILVEKIRLMIGERVDLNADLFNEKLESLKRRVEQLKCTNTHEEITKMLKKISKLERCIEPVVAAQGKVFSKSAVAQTFKQFPHPPPRIRPHRALSPKLAEKFEDPPLSSETKRGFCVKSKGDCTAMGPQRN